MITTAFCYTLASILNSLRLPWVVSSAKFWADLAVFGWFWPRFSKCCLKYHPKICSRQKCCSARTETVSHDTLNPPLGFIQHSEGLEIDQNGLNFGKNRHFSDLVPREMLWMCNWALWLVNTNHVTSHFGIEVPWVTRKLENVSYLNGKALFSLKEL